MPIGSLISAGANLLGGLFNRQSSENANERNYQAQKEFAQQGLRWKVADAEAAGVHPLYALGAQGQSFSPSFVGDTGVGQGLSNAGQDISRAAMTTATNNERDSAYNQQLRTLALERGSLENELLRTQIRRQVLESGPAFPSAVTRTAEDAAGISVDDRRSPVPLLFSTPTGETIMLPAGVTPTQEIEDLFGEIAGEFHGSGLFLRHLVGPETNTGRPGTYQNRNTRYFTGGSF